MLNIHKIQARDLPDLWFQAVHDILEQGRRFKIDRGSYAGQTRLEYDYFIGHVLNPGHGSGTPEILPQIPAHIGIPNPVDFNYVYGGEGYNRSYVEYVMTPTKEEGESYTYGERLTQYPIPWNNIAEYNKDWNKHILIQDEEIWKDRKIITAKEGQFYINQIELIIWTYKNKGHRNNQMVLQVAKPSDCLLADPPCLRFIDTRIQSDPYKERANLNELAFELEITPWDGEWSIEEIKNALRNRWKGDAERLEIMIKKCEAPTLHFFVYFRSWDLWGGFPANLAGIQELKGYMASEIGVEDGEMVVESKGLHLYGYAEDLAKMRCMKK